MILNPNPPIPCPFSKGIFEKLYYKDLLTPKQIAEKALPLMEGRDKPVSMKVFYRWVKEFGFTPFSASESHRLTYVRRPELRADRAEALKDGRRKPGSREQMQKIQKIGTKIAAKQREVPLVNLVCFLCGKKYQLKPYRVSSSLRHQGFEKYDGKSIPEEARLFCSAKCRNRQTNNQMAVKRIISKVQAK